MVEPLGLRFRADERGLVWAVLNVTLLDTLLWRVGAAPSVIHSLWSVCSRRKLVIDGTLW